MDYGNHSLPQLLITHQVSLSDLCFYFDLPEETFTGPDDTSRITNFLTTLQNSNRLPELYSYLETSYPQVQWQAPQGGINLAAARDIEIEIGGDMVAGNKIIETNHYIQEQVIVQGVEITDQEQLPPEDGDPPYKGLSYFTEADAEWFFGREAATANLVNRLHDLNFLAVIGASGSGKSSLIRAGVIPVMKRQKTLPDGTEPPLGQWEVRTLTPTTRPLTKLATTVFPDDHTQQATFQEQALQTPNALRQALDAQSQTDHKLFLFIDQFEEVFTLCHDEAERQAFIDNLLTLTAESATVKIIMTFRADFYADCLRYEGLRTILKTNQEPLGAMTLQELTDAVLGPIAKGNWQFQEGLIEEIMEEVGEEPGRLPLLSHALLETWRRRRGRMLTLSAYREAGKIQGAIAQTAEQTYTQLTAEHQKVTQQIFLRLTELGEGTQDTRRRVKRDELGSSDTIKLVTQQLANARLITTSQEEVDVAHEALIREWPRLREWLDANREGLRLHRQITEAAQTWHELEQDQGALFRGVRLSQAQEWAAENPEQLNTLEQNFLNASAAVILAEEQAREEARQRELQQARELAAAQEAERKRAEELAATERQRAKEQEAAASGLRKRLFYAIAALVLAAVFLITAVFFGVSSSQNATEALNNAATATIAEGEALQQAAAAEAAEVVARTQANIAATAETDARTQANIAATAETDALIAADEAVQQANLAATREAEANRQQQISEAQSLAALAPVLQQATAGDMELANLLAVQAIHMSRDELNEAIPAVDRVTRSYILDPAVANHHKLLAHTESVNEVALSPNGQTLASAGEDTTVRLWDLANPTEPPIVLNSHIGPVRTVSFSPDGRLLASASEDSTVRLWNLVDLNQPPTVLRSHTGAIWSVTFSPDGQTLASASVDATVKLWSLTDLTLIPATLRGHTGPVRGLAFSPDGQKLASGGDDATIRLWDMADLEADPAVLEGHVGIVRSVAFAPDATASSGLLASASLDKTVRLWDLANPAAESVVLEDTAVLVTSVAFSPDGQTLASTHTDTTIKLWNLLDLTAKPTVLLGHTSSVWSAIFSPNETNPTLISASVDRSIIVWDISEPPPDRTTLQGHTDWVYSVAFSSDASLTNGVLASASDDTTVRLWDMANPAAEPIILQDHTDFVLAVALSPEATINTGLLASAGGPLGGGGDTAIRLWNLSDLTVPPAILGGHTAAVNTLAFSPHDKLLASGSDDTSIKLWDFSNTNRDPIILHGHAAPVYAVTFAPHEPRLASAGADATINLWDLSELTAEPTSINAHEEAIYGLAFSPDGQWLASASADLTIKLWNLSNLEADPIILSGHTEAVRSVAFSADGLILASASEDTTIRLWDISNPTALPTILRGHTNFALSITFMPNGQTFASASGDSTVRLWPSLNVLASIACEETWRNMTLDEWEEFVGKANYECICGNRPPHPTVVDASFPIAEDTCPLHNP